MSVPRLGRMRTYVLRTMNAQDDDELLISALQTAAQGPDLAPGEALLQLCYL